MDKRKELIQEYKERQPCGGVYTITNTVNGKYLLGHTPNLQGMRNRFEFSVATNSAMQLKLQADWKEHGAQAFVFEVLEEMEKKPEQTQQEFLADLKALEELWREKLDPAKAY